MNIGVLIADDEALVRSGFRMVLEAEDDLEVIGEAATGRQAIDSARRLKPDVVLMDVRMPELDGIAATREIAADERPIYAGADPDHVRPRRVRLRRARAGASGFLLKELRRSS